MKRGGLLLSVVVAVLALAGCATQQILTQSKTFASNGDYEQAINSLDAGLAQYPSNVELRKARLALLEDATNRLLAQANTSLREGNFAEADAKVQRLLALAPRNPIAQAALVEIERERRVRAIRAEAERLITAQDWAGALALIEKGLKEKARDPALLKMQQAVEARRRATDGGLVASLADTRAISLEFRDANLRMVLEALSRGTGVNFIVDRDVRADQRVTIFLRQTSIEDALNVLATSNQLGIRTLNSNTVLVYPNTPEKAREYRDLLIRSFYLANADAKQTASLLKSMLRLKDVFVDDKLNMLVVRDVPEAIRLAERLVAMHDLSEPEVMLEVELLEVTASRLTELGIRYPDSITLTALGPGGAGSLTLEDLGNINSSTIGVSPAPSLTLNLKREIGDLNVLANPRIRARNREKAQILIGDKVPIITSTATSTGFVSESVQYVDVGIKLNVEPAVHYDDEIEIKVAVEVSSLVSEVRTRTTLAYQIGTRSASTTLRLKDGETQILAGLISSAERTNANRIPGLGDLPVAGRLFSSQRDSNQRTEVILAITPRLVRAARAPSASMTEFWSGTETTLRLSPLTLEPKASATGVDRGATAPGAGGTPVGDPTGSAGFSVIRSTPPAASSAGVTSGLPGPGGPPSLGGPSAPGSAAQEWASGVTRRVARQVETLLLGPANAQVGALFEATVRLKADGGVRALPLQIAFDPAKLQVVEVREGDYFKQDGGQTTFAHQVAPETGRILISAQRNGGEGVRGEDAVATIRFRAVAPGSTKVAVSTANAVGLEGQAPSTVLAVPLEITIK